MAFGDIGGAVTELVITCRTPESGPVIISKGHAVKLSGSYEVDSAMNAGDPVFGEALADEERNGVAIPVKVRGISVFEFTGPAPVVDGVAGIVASGFRGAVKAPGAGNGGGINLKVDLGVEKVHVLL